MRASFRTCRPSDAIHFNSCNWHPERSETAHRAQGEERKICRQPPLAVRAERMAFLRLKTADRLLPTAPAPARTIIRSTASVPPASPGVALLLLLQTKIPSRK